MSSSAARRKWGTYLPHQRFNVDQVPLPFVNDMDSTYEEVGAKRVAINQNGPSLGKRQASAQVCFRGVLPDPPEGDDAAKAKFKRHFHAQPKKCIIFRGTGQRISAEEKASYPDDFVALWQPKAWVDRPTAEAWAKQVWLPFIKAERDAGVAGDDDRYRLFQDNLDSQLQPAYLKTLREDCSTDNHQARAPRSCPYPLAPPTAHCPLQHCATATAFSSNCNCVCSAAQVPPNKTDQVQPVDRGLGRHIKIYLGQEMDAWLQDADNLGRWEGNDNPLSASDRRILLANWYCTAVDKALEGSSKRRYFEVSGALLTADGTDDDLIKLEGVPAGDNFSF